MYEKSTKKGIGYRYLVICALFTALTAIGAYIKIPVPIIPFTMQTFFVILSGLMLGPKYGLFSMVMYMLIGLIGIPIFTMGGGISYIFKPTFGYIIGFCLGAYTAGAIAKSKPKPNYFRLLLAAFVGMIVIYAVGITYFYTISRFVIKSVVAIKTLLINCFLLTIVGDGLSCVLAAVIAKRLNPQLNKLGFKN